MSVNPPHQPPAALHGVKEEDETGYLRRAFLEMIDLLMAEIRDKGAGPYLLACISACERPEDLPDVLGVAMRLTRQTVAAGFMGMYSNEAEHRKVCVKRHRMNRGPEHLGRHDLSTPIAAMYHYRSPKIPQARKSYESVPWKALGTVTSITGPSLSAAIIDLILSVSTGGHTLFDRCDLLSWG